MDPATPAKSLTVHFGGATDVGKRRENNEDSSFCAALPAGPLSPSALLIVSDGVGGAKAGEVASRIAVETMHLLLTERLAKEAPPADGRGWLDAAIRETDRCVRQAATETGANGMGATLSVVWVAGRNLWWGQAGDSRTYIFRDAELRQISRDQSPVGRLRANGQLSEEEARSHPYRHLIDQCLGGGGAPIEPETGKHDLQEGDILLLCSDGLSDGLWDKEIAETLKSAKPETEAAELARVLVARANEASGKDNITAVVARIRAEASPPAKGWRRLFGL